MRKKTKAGKPEGKEKRAQGKATEAPRAGEKHHGSDPDDRATLTEMMKRKALEEKKRKLDEQAAAMLASKKARLKKEAPPAPSESEIDLGVFTATHGNLLEKKFEASGSGGVKPMKIVRRFDISKITPPSSPPSRTFGLSTPPEVPAEKEKHVPVEVE
ncbi:hypothetical protein Hanom_Chr07g00599821 [Helianthus anomalus]